MRVWDVIYPVGMYLVITNIVMFVLGLIVPETSENYLIRHIIVSVVAFPFVWSYYRRPPYYCIGNIGKTEGKKRFSPGRILLAVVAGAASGVALNNLISLTPLVSLSSSYQEVSKGFYGSTLLLEILATCVITPVLEEVLYRGVAYQRLRGWLGVWPAVFVSAVLFGAMHLNLVQFLYAGLIGILLAWLMEYFGLAAAVAAHAGANLISILRSEISILSFGEPGTAGFFLETGAFAVLGILSIAILVRSAKREKCKNGTKEVEKP